MKLALLHATVVCSLCVSFAGCHSPAPAPAPAPSVTTAPAPSATTADALAAAETATWACGGWRGTPVLERNQVVLLDILFNRPRPNEPVTSLLSQRGRLERAGALVVHEYPFGAVRAKMVVADFERIAGSVDVNLARLVRDSTRYSWGAIIGYRVGPTADDERVVRDLGGREIRRDEGFHVMMADLPDTAFVALRGRPEVYVVEPSGMLCLRGSPAIAVTPTAATR